MKLGYNWFYRPRLDIEMKQYEALAFVQYLENCLREKVLEPPYLELKLQETVIGQFLDQNLHDRYKGQGTLQGIDWSNKDLVYLRPEEDELVPVKKIAGFLFRRIRPFRQRFEELRQEVSEQINIERVGLLPFYLGEGWLLMGLEGQIDVYQFKDAGILNASGARSIETCFYTSYKRSVFNTPESVKLDLIKQYQHFPNPATYFVNYVSTYPLETTYLPLVREKIARELN